MGKKSRWPGLQPISLDRGHVAYHCSDQEDLPELVQAEVLASRDPRLSPGLPPSSIYFRVDGLESDDGNNGEDVASRHSENWFDEDLSKEFEEKAKNLKVRIHVNPKFFPNIGGKSETPCSPDEKHSDGEEKVETPVVPVEISVTPEEEPQEPGIAPVVPVIDSSESVSKPSAAVPDVNDVVEIVEKKAEASNDAEKAAPDAGFKPSVEPVKHLPPLLCVSSLHNDRKRSSRHERDDSKRRRKVSSEGAMWDELDWDELDQLFEEPKWSPFPKPLNPMSRFSRDSYREACQKYPGRLIDRLFSRFEYQLSQELHRVMNGDRCDDYKHLSPLSSATLMESSFVDCPLIKNVCLLNLKQWMTKQPLSMLLAGKIDASKLKRPADLKGSKDVDRIAGECVDGFLTALHTSVYDPQDLKAKQVIPMPKSTTDDIVNQYFSRFTESLGGVVEKLQANLQNKKETLSGRDVCYGRSKASCTPVNVDFRHFAKLNRPVNLTNKVVDSELTGAIREFAVMAQELTSRIGIKHDDLCTGNEKMVEEEKSAEAMASAYSPTHPTDNDDTVEKNPGRLDSTEEPADGRRKRLDVEATRKAAEAKASYSERDGCSGGGSYDASCEKSKKKKADESNRDDGKGKTGGRGRESKRRAREDGRTEKVREMEKDRLRRKSNEGRHGFKSKKAVTSAEVERNHSSTQKGEECESMPSSSKEASQTRMNLQKAMVSQWKDQTFYSDAHLSSVLDTYTVLDGGVVNGGLAKTDPASSCCWSIFMKFKETNKDVLDNLRDLCTDGDRFVTKMPGEVHNYLWALVLAFHERDLLQMELCEQPRKSVTDRQEPVEMKDSNVNEYGSALDGGKPDAIPYKEEASERDEPMELEEEKDAVGKDDAKKTKSNRLLMAFRQAVDLKNKKPEETKSKVHKLSPAIAAKRAAPKSAKLLFKPPTAAEGFQMLQEEKFAVKQAKATDGSDALDTAAYLLACIGEVSTARVLALQMFAELTRNFICAEYTMVTLDLLMKNALHLVKGQALKVCGQKITDFLTTLDNSNSEKGLLRTALSEMCNANLDSGSTENAPGVESCKVEMADLHEDDKENKQAKLPLPKKQETETSSSDSPELTPDGAKGAAIPKGDKFLAAFRQAMIAKKKAQKEGHSRGKYATSSRLDKAFSTSSKAKASPQPSPEDDGGSSKIMEALTALQSTTVPPDSPPASTKAMPITIVSSSTAANVPGPMEEDFNQDVDMDLSGRDSPGTPTEEDSNKSFAFSSQASNVQEQPQSSDSHSIPLPVSSAPPPLPSAKPAAPPPLPSEVPSSSGIETYYTTSSSSGNELQNLTDADTMRKYQEQVQAWQQHHQHPPPGHQNFSPLPPPPLPPTSQNWRFPPPVSQAGNDGSWNPPHQSWDQSSGSNWNWNRGPPPRGPPPRAPLPQTTPPWSGGPEPSYSPRPQGPPSQSHFDSNCQWGNETSNNWQPPYGQHNPMEWNENAPYPPPSRGRGGPWRGGRGRGSPHNMVRPVRVGFDANSVPELGESPASNLFFYVFRTDRPVCASLQRFLTFMGAQSFDPHNIRLLKNCIQPRYVFIHADDLHLIHSIPNLLDLKHPLSKTTFVTYRDVWDVKHKLYEQNPPVLSQGGVLVMEDTSMLNISVKNLEMIFKYLHGQTTSEEMWFCLVRQSVFEEMENRRAAIDSGSADRQRLSRLLEILVKYQDLGVVQTISIAESPSHCLSPPEFLPICVKEQMKRVHQCRHVIFITDLVADHMSLKDFNSNGINVLSARQYIQFFVQADGEEPHGTFPPDYGLRSSPTYVQVAQSSAVDKICPTLAE